MDESVGQVGEEGYGVGPLSTLISVSNFMPAKIGFFITALMIPTLTDSCRGIRFISVNIFIPDLCSLVFLV